MVKISIIIPVYNVEPYVEACIRSVMRQTYDGAMECIVVDDCGTDGSMAVVEKMIEDYDGSITFKVLHHIRNRGLSAARNTGMDVATGDYLFFLDSDDELLGDSMEKLARPLLKERHDVVLGFVNYMEVILPDVSYSTRGPQELNITADIAFKPPMILQTYRREWAVVAWNRLYRAAFLRQHQLRFKEGILYEDNLWSFQIACLATSLYIVSHATYVHKKRAGSIMNTQTDSQYVENMLTVIKEMSCFVSRNHLRTPETNRLLHQYTTNLLRHYTHSIPEYITTYRVLCSCIHAPISHHIHYCLIPAQSIIERIKRFLRRNVHLFLLKHYPKVLISRRWERKFGYPIDWKHPRDLNEKIQWLLIYSDTSAWTRLTDKYKVREYIQEKGLGHLLIPLYGVWDNAEQIDFAALPSKFVLKCTHDCGSTIIVDKNAFHYNQADICKTMNRCLRRDYGYQGEIHYRGIPPRIIAEECLEMSTSEKTLSSSLIDYKVWCFDGIPYYINTYYNRTRESLYFDVHDLNWDIHPEYTQLSGRIKQGDGRIPKPTNLGEMLEAASILSRGFPEVRVDFYDIKGHLYFGELTFTSSCGMMQHLTPEFLKKMGDFVTLPTKK